MDELKTANKKSGVNLALLLPVLMILAGLLTYLYFQIEDNENQAINRHYLRVLGEASQSVNDRLQQIKSTYKFGANKSLLTQYRVDDKNSDASSCKDISKKANYSLNNGLLQYSEGQPCWSVPLTNLIPDPSHQFSQYLLVTGEHQVLASKGDLRALSIIDTTQFGKQIALELNRDWVKLASDFSEGAKSSSNANLKAQLPGYSYFLDIDVNPGQYRLYLFPFSIDPAFASSDDNASQQLYLLGVVPKAELNANSSKRWNFSNYLITLLVLIFILVMLRLFLLSEHQPVDRFFYFSSLYASFLLFSALASALFAYSEASLENGHKAKLAVNQAQITQQRLTTQLQEVLIDLAELAGFYRDASTTSWLNGEAAITPSTATPRLHHWNTRHAQCEIVARDRRANEPASNNSECAIDATKKYGPVCVFFGRGMQLIKTQPDPTGTTQEFDCREELTDNLPHQWRAQWTLLNDNQWLDASQRTSTYINNAFLMNESGWQIGPQFYYKEFHRRPQLLSLSHRDYFKKIAEKHGWNAPKLLQTSKFSQIYIQRLRNLTDGSLGTTLSVPLNLAEHFYVLAADIHLPALEGDESINPSFVADITTMVVDRTTGDVLFHQDSGRVLTENLFAAGSETQAIRNAIQQGKDSSTARLQPIAGSYQGLPGWFISHKTPLDQWAIVTFYPEESLNNYFSNIFLVNFSHFVVVLLVCYFCFWISKTLGLRSAIKRKLGVHPCIEGRRIMLFLSILVFSQIAGFWLGFAINRETSGVNFAHWLLCPLFLLAVLVWGGVRYCVLVESQTATRPAERALSLRKLFTLMCSHLQQPVRRMLVVCALLGIAIAANLDRVGYTAAGAINWYYASVAAARTNQASHELLTRANQWFPNSISDYKQNPYAVLGTEPPRVATQLADGRVIRKRANLESLLPEHVASLSQFTQLTDMPSWIDRYLWRSTQGNSKKRLEQTTRSAAPLLHWIAVTFCAVIFAWLWLMFNKNLLYGRVFGSSNMLRFLNKLYRENALGSAYQPDPLLRISPPPGSYLKNTDHNAQSERDFVSGLPLNLMLHNATAKILESHQLFSQLLRQNPDCRGMLEAGNAQQPTVLPTINLHCVRGADGLELQVSGTSSNLHTPALRNNLLQFLTQLKILKTTGAIAKLTVYCNTGSMIMLLSSKNMREQHAINPSAITAEEYQRWAQFLKDFSIDSGSSFDALDMEFIRREIAAMPCLAFIQTELDAQCPQYRFNSHLPIVDEYRWTHLMDTEKSTAERYSIHFLQLKAGAIYRALWSASSAPEKLALFYLAGGRRVNPRNIKVLENLAARGLTRVYRGRLRIVNQSFADYVMHAEDSDSLRTLIKQGGLGAWNDYRVPVYLMMAAALIALSFVSGNSFYMIASSAVGALALFSNLISGVGFIRTRFLS